jgi:hypothetical protein
VSLSFDWISFLCSILFIFLIKNNKN